MSEFDFSSLKKKSSEPEQPAGTEQPTKSENELLTNQTSNIPTPTTNGSKKPTKDIILEDLEYVLDNSGYKVIIELNEKTPTRLKSGILQANKIPNYWNMTNDELDNEISKLLTKGFLKILKGSESNDKNRKSLK